MKKIIFLTLILPVLACSAALAGDITPGSVPGSLNYQGRLERDNAPITGPIHLTFQIFTTPTGGTAVYAAPEIVVNAVQGIFSASITPPWTIFSNASGTLYLEVKVESDVLSPREPLSSVAYALVAKKLEDGSFLKVSSLTTTGNVGIGTDSPTQKLTIDGSIKLLNAGNELCFFDGSCMITANYAVVPGGLTSPGPSVIETGTFGPLYIGSMTFFTSTVQRMVISDASRGGRIGIGAAAIANPLGTLDIDGSLYVSDAGGIYDRNDGELNIKQDLVVEGGQVRGVGAGNYISIGETTDEMSFRTAGTERLRLDPSGNVSVGNIVPTTKLHVAGNILSNAGVRGGTVSMGNYGGGALTNEIRTQTAVPLLLQQNAYNVGIGTNAPTEKLHVRGNIKAEGGMIADTVNFSDSVRVDSAGNFYANSGHNTVELSSTTIYGTLRVTGGVGSDQGFPAYLTSTQTFTGQNTFTNQVTVSSDIVTVSRLGAGVVGFDFGTAAKYLQIGDSAFSTDAAAYIVSGAAKDSRLFFYRGTAEAARFETQAGSNLALVLNNTKSLVDSTYYKLHNSVFWVSPGVSDVTPAVYVSSSLGNVGIGTAILEPTHRLTVAGNLKISGATSNGIIFADGTILRSSGTAGLSIGSLANNDDAVVQADADTNGTGDVILKAGSLEGLIVENGGRVGIGTLSPVANSKLNVRGGDLVLGTPSTISDNSAAEDIFVAGNVVVDGGITQRSAQQVKFSALMVGSDVYLSTGASAMTRIGSQDAPNYELDVTGDINADGNIRTGAAHTVRISNNGTVGSSNANATWDGNTVDVDHGGTGVRTFTTGGILFGNLTGAIGVTPRLTAGQLLIGDNAGEPTATTLTQASANRVVITSASGSITLSLPQDIDTAANPTFAGATLTGLTGMLKGNGAGAVSNITGTQNRVTRWSDNDTIGASAILTDNGARLTVAAPADLTGSITTASSGTFQAIGATQYSIRTSSGIIVQGGPLNMNSAGKVINLVDPSGSQDAATKSYVDNATGGGGAWGLLGNNTVGVEFLGTTGAGDALVFKTGGILPANTRMTITAAGVVELQNALGVLYGGTGNTTGLAATASALAANPNDCTLPNVAMGIDANGTAVCSTPSNISGNAAGTASALAANPADCTLPDVALGIGANGAAVCSTPSNISGNAVNVTGTVAIGNGGTGQTTAANARTALGVPATGTAAVGYVVCLKAGGTNLGYCTNISTGTGDCTCN